MLVSGNYKKGASKEMTNLELSKKPSREERLWRHRRAIKAAKARWAKWRKHKLADKKVLSWEEVKSRYDRPNLASTLANIVELLGKLEKDGFRADLSTPIMFKGVKRKLNLSLT